MESKVVDVYADEEVVYHAPLRFTSETDRRDQVRECIFQTTSRRCLSKEHIPKLFPRKLGVFADEFSPLVIYHEVVGELTDGVDEVDNVKETDGSELEAKEEGHEETKENANLTEPDDHLTDLPDLSHYRHTFSNPMKIYSARSDYGIKRLPEKEAHRQRVGLSSLVPNFDILPERYHLLLEGAPGTGKTTLSHFLSYCRYEQTSTTPSVKAVHQWIKQFGCVLTVSLAKLNNFNATLSTTNTAFAARIRLGEFLLKEVLDTPEDELLGGRPEERAQAVLDALFKRGDKPPFLLVLDGLDELPLDMLVKNSIMNHDILKELVEYPYWIMFSRNYQRHSTLHAQIDRVLNIVGIESRNNAAVLDEPVEEIVDYPYICRYFHQAPDKGQRLVAYIKKQPLLKSFVKVPVCCEILCFLWQADESKLIDLQVMTQSQLYCEVILRLLVRANSKYGETVSTAQALLDYKLSLSLVKGLAFEQLLGSEQAITNDTIDNLYIDNPEAVNLTGNIIDVFMSQNNGRQPTQREKVGLARKMMFELQILTQVEAGESGSCEFIHSSFQSFLAACELCARLFQEVHKSDLSPRNQEALKVEALWPSEWIARNKYFNKYHLLMRFVADLLVSSVCTKLWASLGSGDSPDQVCEDTRQLFWQDGIRTERGVVGDAHMGLLLNLQLGMKSHYQKIPPFGEQAHTVGVDNEYQAIERYLCQQIYNSSIRFQYREYFQFLSDSEFELFYPNILIMLRQNLEHEYNFVKADTFRVIAELDKYKMFPGYLDKVYSFMYSPDRWLKKAACDVIRVLSGSLNLLTEDLLSELINCYESNDKMLSKAAVSTIRVISQLPESGQLSVFDRAKEIFMQEYKSGDQLTRDISQKGDSRESNTEVVHFPVYMVDRLFENASYDLVRVVSGALNLFSDDVLSELIICCGSNNKRLSKAASHIIMVVSNLAEIDQLSACDRLKQISNQEHESEDQVTRGVFQERDGGEESTDEECGNIVNREMGAKVILEKMMPFSFLRFEDGIKFYNLQTGEMLFIEDDELLQHEMIKLIYFRSYSDDPQGLHPFAIRIREIAETGEIMIENSPDVSRLQSQELVSKLLMQQIDGAPFLRANVRHDIVLSWFWAEAELGYVKSEDEPLIIFAELGFEPLCKLLLEKNVDVNLVSHKGVSSLWTAAQNGHKAVCQLLLDNGADVNQVSNDGASPLYIAAQNGYQDVCRLLLDKGADLNQLSNDGVSPLSIAANQGHIAVCQELIKSGANPNHYIQSKRCPLSNAVYNEHEAVCELLIKEGANVNQVDSGSLSALMLAVVNGNESICQLLLNKGAEVNHVDGSGESALIVAANLGYEAICKILLQKGAKVNQREEHGWSPLWFAALEGHVGVCQLLLNKKAKINQAGSDGVTPFLIAAQMGRIEVCRLLLDRGANIHKVVSGGVGVLYLAAQKGHEVICQFLLDNGFRVNGTTTNGVSSLWIAASRGHSAVCQLLLASGANPNIVRADGTSPLMIASYKGHAEICKLLLDGGAKVNQRRADGSTSLYGAAHEGYLAVCQTLIEEGANINQAICSGESPLHAAAQNGHFAVCELLIQCGAHIDQTTKNGETPIYLAVKNGHDTVCQLLLNNGADINQECINGESLFFNATICGTNGQGALGAQSGHEKVCRVLLKKDVDVHQRTKIGTNMLMAPALMGHEAVCEVLLEHGAILEDLSAVEQAELFLKFIKRNNLPVCQRLVEQGVDVNQADKDGNSALLMAVTLGNVALSKLLIEHHANVNYIKPGGSSILHTALVCEKIKIAQLLIEKGADVNHQNSERKTPLQIAKEKGFDELGILIQQRAITISMASRFFNATQAIFWQNYKKVLICLLLYGLFKNTLISEGMMLPFIVLLIPLWQVLKSLYRYIDKDACIALSWVIYFGNVDLCKWLIDSDARVNQSVIGKSSPLFLAAQDGHEAVCKFLLEKGANVNQAREDGASPLWIAAREGYQAVCQLLLEKGAIVNLVQESGLSSLYIAAHQGHESICQLLLDNGAKINQPASDGVSPLMIAAQEGHESLCHLLLTRGADVNQISKLKGSSLYVAAQNGHASVCQLLLDKGAEINLVTKYGMSALSISAYQGHMGICALLLENGADVNLSSKDTPSPLICAEGRGHSAICTLLVEHGATIGDLSPINRVGLLVFFVKRNNLAVCKRLVDQGVNVNQVDNNGRTALLVAVQLGNLEASKFLMDHGADLHLRDALNKTALQVAEEKGFNELAELIRQRLTTSSSIVAEVKTDSVSLVQGPVGTFSGESKSHARKRNKKKNKSRRPR